MQNNNIPISYFPTTIIFVDDSKDFLTNLTIGLNPNFSFKCYYSPSDALKAIHSIHQQNFLNDATLDMSFYASCTPYSIHHEIYNPLRFCEISVIITDYDMPDMNGLEFCNQMETSCIKRILLTGKASEDTTLKAFNKKLIDFYLQKQTPNLKQELNTAILNLQMEYFQEMSRSIAKFMPSHTLQDPQVIQLFNQIILENNIIEYYLMDAKGSYLMLDADANISYFLVDGDKYSYSKNANLPMIYPEKILSYNEYLSHRVKNLASNEASTVLLKV